MAILLCVTAVFCVPFESFAEGVQMDALASAVESVPSPDTWDEYIDISALEQALEQARLCLGDTTGEITQQQVDAAVQALEEAVSGLKKHTTGIALDSDSLSVAVGDTGSVNTIITPADGADTVSWSVSSPAVRITSGSNTGCEFSVASYSADPVKVTAKCNGKEASCTVNVLNPAVCAVVTVDPVAAYRTKTAQASVKAFGADGNPATDKISWLWTSSNTDIADISAVTGLITCKKAGETTITANGIVDGKTIEASTVFYVNDFTPVTSLTPVDTLLSKEINMVAGSSISYELRISDNATIKTLAWGVTDPSVLSVSDIKVNGSVGSATLKALKAGKTTLTVKATDGSGVTRTVSVNVQPQISSLKLSSTVVVLNPKQTKKLSVTISPTNAGNQVINWSSSDKSVCTVDYKGNLTAKGIGVCNIFAEATDGSGKKATCCVRVADPSAQIIISKKSVSMKSGTSVSVTATVNTVTGKSYATTNEVNWSTSNKAVATVSTTGKITAVAAGSAVITASAKDNADIKSTCKITVVTPVTGLTINCTSVKLGEGSTKTILPTVQPADATDRSVTWTSSNKAVATVSTTGKVVAVKPGTATITCKTTDGGFTAKCAVTVITPVTSIKLSPSAFDIYTGSTRVITATVSPSTATDKSVTFKSSDTKVATVSSTGTVKGIKAGYAVITVKSADGKCTAQCAVNVLQKVTSVTLDPTKTCYVGQVVSLGASVAPADATNKKLTYTSSDTSVATVTETGFITAKKKGSTAITVKSADGGYTATCILTVTPKISVTDFKLDVSEKALKTKETYTLKPLFSPTDASEKGVTYKSSNAAVASVSSAGKITAKGPGTCTVTAVTTDGGFVSTCKVTVTQPVTGIEFPLAAYKIPAGKIIPVKPNVLPANASNKSVKWKSSDKAIAIVSSAGNVKGVSTGKCTLTCTSVDGGFTATCVIEVYKEVTGIKITKTKAKVAAGKQIMLVTKFTPEDATNKTLVWKSSDPSVATVSTLGKVAGLTAGTTVITCKSADSGLTAKCTVTVFRPAEKVTLNFTSVRLDAGKTKTLKATVTPKNATYKSVTWNSSDANVVTVDKYGKLTAVKAGKARISAVSEDGYCSGYCSVTVVQPPKKVTVTTDKTQLDVGCATQLKATVSPSNAYSKDVVWSSSDTATASVSASGVVTAKKAGKVIITCTTVAGAKKAETEILCKIPPESMKLNKTSVTLLPNKTTTLKAIFTPADTTVKTAKWSSSNPAVIKVSSKGKIKAVAIGSATITAKSTDGGLKATCFVTVPRRATGIKLNKTSAKVDLNGKYTLKATVLPADATYDDVTWSSSNKSVATVSSSGVVYGKALGKAVITATSVDGGFKKSCTVTVITPPSSVKISKTSATVNVGSSFTLKAKVLPEDATYKTITWKSSDTSVATVSGGKVTTKKAGTVTISAISSKSTVKAVCTVKVIVPVTGVKLNKTSASVYTGSTLTLTPTVSPSNASVKTVKWTSSDTAVATVSSSGVVKGIAVGKAVITCKTTNGAKTATCTVTVKKAVSSVSLNVTSKTADTGTAFALKATVLPADATNKAVSWSSSDSSVARVSTSGVVTLLSAGTAKITVKTADGGLTATCTVTVTQPVKEIQLKSSMHTFYNAEFTVNATVLPKNATDKTLLWTSSDESILTVDENGNVKVTGTGTAQLTCTDVTGKVSAVCTVTADEVVMLSETEVTLSIGEKCTLEATVLPLSSSQDVTFESRNTEVAEVSAYGEIIACNPGQAVIIVKNSDSTASATCVVTVTE